MAAALQRKAEYLLSLSEEGKQRYENKITGTGLDIDPHVIDKWLDEWTQDPANFPRISWSDICLNMVSTRSLYTKKIVKVRFP